MALPVATRAVTMAVLAVCAVALVGWDIYVAVNDVQGDTISELALSMMQHHPLATLAVQFSLGVIVGHLFWPQFTERKQP